MEGVYDGLPLLWPKHPARTRNSFGLAILLIGNTTNKKRETSPAEQQVGQCVKQMF